MVRSSKMLDLFMQRNQFADFVQHERSKKVTSKYVQIMDLFMRKIGTSVHFYAHLDNFWTFFNHLFKNITQCLEVQKFGPFHARKLALWSKIQK